MPTDDTLAKVWRRRAAWFAAGGVLLRLLLYALRFPVWGDEAFVAVNFLEGNWAALTKPLINAQVAPLGFLWGSFAAYRWLGPSEWTVRLLPEAAGIAALLLFWRLAVRELPPRAACFAVAFLAMAVEPVRLAATLKPYSLDLLAAVVLLRLGMSALRPPGHWAPRLGLAVAGPLAMPCSYPAVFVAGGVGLALLLRSPGRGAVAWIGTAAFGVLTCAAFAAHYWWIGKAQSQADAQAGLLAIWGPGFPPERWTQWPAWMWEVHFGAMVSYPAGSKHGGGTFTALLMAAGIVALWRAGRRAQLVALLAPFGLALLAAVLRKFPYGDGARLSQHLAPAVCLLAGIGLAMATRRLAMPRRRWAVRLALAGCVAVGAGQAVRFVAKPYRDADALRIDRFARRLAALVRPGDQVCVSAARSHGGSLLHWHTESRGLAVRWEQPPDATALRQTLGRVWYVDFRAGVFDAPRPEFVRAALAGLPGWTVSAPASEELRGAKGCGIPDFRLDFYRADPPDDGPPPSP